MDKQFSLSMKWKIFLMQWRFRKRLGYWPNLENPQSFNEKIQHRKFYWHNPSFSEYADKYAVRAYVKATIGEEYLVPLIAVHHSVSELDFDAYGPNYVIKLTHDSGGVFLCKNGKINRAKVLRRLKRKFKRNMGIKRNETWYTPIKPKIIVEALLQDKSGNVPEDFKIHVFNKPGEAPRCFLQVDYQRFSNKHRSLYSESGELLPFSLKVVNKFVELDQPKNLSKMFELAKKLSQGLDYSRIDLYNIEGKIYFGEMTFAHAGGFGRFTPDEYDFKIGEWWQLESPFIATKA